jgi:hypothetical protein
MKQRYLPFSIVTVVLLLVASFSATLISAAQIPSVPSPPKEYLITLPIVSPDPTEIPADLGPDQAIEYARSLTYEQAQPILDALNRLRAEGQVTAFEVRSDLHSIVIKNATPEAIEHVAHLQSTAGIVGFKEAAPAACAVAAAEALPEQVLGLSRAHAMQAETMKTVGTVQATNPSIAAYAQPGGTWSYIYGSATSNVEVEMRILRGGRVIATQSATSSNHGYYYFNPSWQSCPTSGYNWTLRPGDVVEVTAQGNTVSTTVVALSAWIDPTTNTVTGKTNPGRTVRISISKPTSDPCTWEGTEQSVTADANGNFTANFTGQMNFDRRASASINVLDANNNSTTASSHAYRIVAQFDNSSFSGYLKPAVDFTATLRRSGNVVATYTGRSDLDSYYYGWFNQTIRSGDIIAVTGGGVTLQYTASDLNMTLDYINNRITGTTAPGRQVRVLFYKNDSTLSVRTSCTWDYECNSGAASGTGNFTIPTTLDWMRGDYAYVYVYDAEGNYQYSGSRYVPAIVGEVGNDSISGYWRDPDVDLTAVLKDSGGVVKATETSVRASWNGSFSTWLGSTIMPADRIELGDGTFTETMTVQNVTARLNSNTNHLAGNAPDRRLFAYLWDFQPDSGYSYGYCQETTVTGGAYNLMFDGTQIGAQDYATVWSTGADGHYTRRDTNAFSINAYKEDNYIWGYSETPNIPVTITLRTGTTTKATETSTSSSTGYYYANLRDNGAPVNIIQGDAVQVQTGDGSNATLQIPELTLNTDAANNRVYGKAPANQPVRPGLQRLYNSGYWASSQNIHTSSAGNYSATFSGLYWSRDCSAMQVGHRCTQPTVSYYTPAGYQIKLEGNRPPSAPADAYESNNTAATAKDYHSIQTHTFHTSDDVDWIKFTVPAADVTHGVPYHIETLNIGWGMDTCLHLYDVDGSTELAYNDDGGVGLASRIVWTPSAAGTYYVKVRPYSSNSTDYCDAYYDLRILPVRAKTFLPLVTRN